jgi:hypothetical protein
MTKQLGAQADLSTGPCGQRFDLAGRPIKGFGQTVRDAAVHLRNGKPVVRRGRKAMGLSEVARLPKS